MIKFSHMWVKSRVGEDDDAKKLVEAIGEHVAGWRDDFCGYYGMLEAIEKLGGSEELKKALRRLERKRAGLAPLDQ